MIARVTSFFLLILFYTSMINAEGIHNRGPISMAFGVLNQIASGLVVGASEGSCSGTSFFHSSASNFSEAYSEKHQ